MFTSVIDISKRKMLKTSLVYLCFSMFTAFFGAIYELFSHEVYSYYMIYAFALPLSLGAFPALIFAISDVRVPGRLSSNLYNSGVAALTVGFIIKGMLDIFGTQNPLLYVYYAVGAVFVVFGVVAYRLKK